MRLIVVGAGAWGAAVAVEARARGLDVTLVERDRPGGGTTSRGVGILRQGQWHPTNVRLVRRSLERMAALDLDPWRLHRTGSVVVVPEAQVARVRELVAMQEAHGVRVERLAPSEARLLPGMAPAALDDVALALHYPEDGWALPRMLAEAHVYHERLDGMRVVRGAARLAPGEGRVEVRVGDETLRADAVVVAAGVWTRDILRGAGLDAPLQAYRTQALRLRHPQAATLPIVHDLAQDCYLRPHWQGQMLVGDGTTTTPEDPADWRRDADPAFVASALARVQRRFPHLGAAEVAQSWAGIEAATPDRLPLVGPHPERPDVWLCAGGNGHGFMRGLALAESLVAMLAGEAPPVDVRAFDPARFAGRMSEPFRIRAGSAIEA